ncbi:MAG: archaemetzincin family Zn-dependent metalloprotease [Euryarchaeota archaeon]|nr:archaemetzincin family Zn-dependent metalloprotease [Euryarchaeota archaeon]
MINLHTKALVKLKFFEVIYIILKLLPIESVQHSVLENISSGIKEIFGEIFEVQTAKEGLEVPKDAYNSSRKQYKSEAFLELAQKLPKHSRVDRILAVTNVDLYAHPLNFIFGQAQKPGKVALISIYRLNPRFYGQTFDEQLYKDRIVKEAVHELGHTLGLAHCKDIKCVMVFSNSIIEVDRKKKYFCEKCWSEVIKWKSK